ncbi:MAG: hypothetical protein ACJ8AO_10285 [Gemmatimonadaceae bacterium]
MPPFAPRTATPRLTALAALAGLLALAACAPAASSGGSASTAPAASRRQADLITAEEIAGTSATTAYHAIEILRPTFLRARGQQSLSGSQSPVAYVNGQRWGNLESLRNLTADDVLSIRRLSASEAQSRYGLDNIGGAIEVTTKSGAPRR